MNLNRMGHISPLRAAEGPSSSEVAPETSPEEAVLKINSKQEVWYQTADGAIVILSENETAQAEKDRQASDPSSPPALGFPKFSAMMEDAEIPGTPAAEAVAAAATPREDFSTYTSLEALRVKMGGDPIREPGKAPYWVMDNGDALVKHLREKGPIRIKEGDVLKMYKVSWRWADGAFTEATPEQIEEAARRSRRGTRKRIPRGGEAAPAAAMGAEPTAIEEVAPRSDRRRDRPGRGERMSENESFAEGMGMFERIYDPNDARERKHRMVPIAFEAAISGKSDAVIERIIERIHNKGKDFPPRETLRIVWEDIKRGRGSRSGERGRSGGRERGRDEGRNRSERDTRTLDEAKEILDDMLDDEDREPLKEIIADGIKGLPTKDLRQFIRYARKHDDVDKDELEEIIGSNNRLKREVGGKKEGGEGRSEAQSGGGVLEGIDQRMAEREARIKKLLEG